MYANCRRESKRAIQQLAISSKAFPRSHRGQLFNRKVKYLHGARLKNYFHAACQLVAQVEQEACGKIRFKCVFSPGTSFYCFLQ